MHRLLAAALITSLLAPAAAAAADDDPPAPPATTYMNAFRVTAEGKGQYDRKDRQIVQGLGWEQSVGAAFDYKVVLPMVWFDDQGHLLGDGDAGGATSEGTLSGAGQSHVVVHAADGDTTGDCAAPLQDVKVRLMGFERGTQPAGADGERVIVTPLPAISFAADCTGAQAGNDQVPVLPGGTVAMDQVFDLPKEATDQDKIIQLVSQTPGQKLPINCPGRSEATISCSFTWSGTVTFDRVSHISVDPGIDVGPETPRADDPPVAAPLPAPAPAPAPAPGPSGPPETRKDASPQVVTVTGVPRLDAKRGRVTVGVSCARACRGTVAAYAKTKRLATKRFSARAGKATKITLSGKALRHRKTIKLVIAAGGAKTSVTVR